MKRYGIAAICGLVLLGALASVGLARGEGNRGDQERPRRRRELRERREPSEPKRLSPRERAKKVFQRLMKELDLDEDKRAEIRAIWKAHRQAVVNWTKEHGEELKAAHKKLRDARREEDRKAIKKAQKEIHEIMETRRPLIRDFMKQLREALSKEQFEKARKILRLGAQRAVGARFEFLRSLRELDLSERQKARIEKIMQEAREKIVNDVLTPRQRRKLEELRKRVERSKPKRPEPKRERFRFMRALGELDVTEEQEVRIRKILKAARAEAREADTPAARQKIMRKAEAKIIKDVLNKEQRRKLQRLRRQWRKKHDRQPARPGRGPRGPRKGPREPEDEEEV